MIMVIEKVVCPFCNCLCDTLMVEVENNRIRKVEGACPKAVEGFLHIGQKEFRPLVNSYPASFTEAFGSLSQLLATRKRLLICGLAETDSETQVEAIKLARSLGGIIDLVPFVPEYEEFYLPPWPLLPTCTLGEVKHKADFLLFWGADPLISHPRLLALLGISPSRPKGKDGRTLAVVDSIPTLTSAIADLFIEIQEESFFPALSFLRAELGQKKNSGGLETEDRLKLEKLAQMMVDARYGVIFVGETGWKSFCLANQFFKVWQQLNARLEFQLLPLTKSLNYLGGEMVMTWQTGYPYAVDFCAGYPRFGPREYTVDRLVRNKEADGILTFSVDHLTFYAENTEIFIPSARPGIETESTIYRLDQIPFAISKLLSPGNPIQVQILQELREEIGKC
jgi:formylmethanofuran dehydrogenase subunit B